MTRFSAGLLLSTLAFFLAIGSGCAKRSEPSASSTEKSPSKYDLGGKGGEGTTPPGDGKRDEKSPSTWKRAGSQAHAARISIGDKEHLPLRGMQMNVRIDGFRARVVIDGYFENDRDRSYEGNFQLRLPDDATPYFFAFGETRWTKPSASELRANAYLSQDEQRKMTLLPREMMEARAATWVAPKEARMVPKDKAAFAFTETVRRQIDPALLEWAGAGVFNARVFPLTPHKIHRVVIGYDVNLVRAGNDFEYRLELPDAGDYAPPHVVIDVASTSPAIDPAAAGKAATVVDGGRSFTHLEDPQDKVFTFRFSKLGNPLLVGVDPQIPQAARFAANVTADLPASKNGPAPLEDRALFALDTSLSSNPDRFNVFLKLLHATLTNNRVGPGAIKKFNVLFFNVETTWWKNDWVDNTKENVDELLAQANTLVLEGATDIGGAISACARPAWALAPATNADRWTTFLLSDGAATWGESDRNVIAHTLTTARRGPIFAYNTGIAGTDTAALAQLTRDAGGAMFSVVGEDEVGSASTAHKLRPYKLLSVSAGTGTEDVMIAGRPRYLYPGQPLFVVGRGTPAATAALSVEVESPTTGKPVTVALKLAPAQSSMLAVRAYGQVATNGLEEMGKSTELIAKSYAIHHRVAGETCSLVMLESDADYQRFNIKPEHEADVVATVLASATAARAELQLRESLGDPKAYMKRWLDDLKDKPGVTLRAPFSDDFMHAVERMPSESFLVRPRPLEVKARSRDAIGSGDFLAQLAKPGGLEYEMVSTEATTRREKLGPADALKSMSSLVEQTPGDGILARDVGFTAMELGLPEHAFFLFRRVADARPWEPQSYKAMADVLAKMGMADLAILYYEVSLQGNWDSRFGEFHRIAAIDYARFLRRIDKGELKTSVPDFAKTRLAAMDKEVNLDGADLVIVITWNTDNSDVDLHVTEPGGEDCYYANRKTKHGGELTTDVTQGYGPEMYVMKKGRPGTYKIRAHYFARQRNRASACTKVYAEVIEKWGTPDERVTERTVTLAEGKQMHDVLDVKR